MRMLRRCHKKITCAKMHLQCSTCILGRCEGSSLATSPYFHPRSIAMRTRHSVLVSFVFVLGMICSVTTLAEAAIVTNLKVPTDIGVFIPCSAGGAGEVVFLSGNLHVLLRFTVNSAGGVHAGAHFQP